MKPRHPLVLIAAVARNGVIGREGQMPWRLPGDMSHFKTATMGRPVLMGRKTFDSIGHPLPGRPTIVLSAHPGFAPDGVSVASTLEDALALADDLARRTRADRIMVAGGATLYRALMPVAEMLLLTEVEAVPDGDTLFPPVDPSIWRRAEQTSAQQEAGDTASYRFSNWRRRQGREDERTASTSRLA